MLGPLRRRLRKYKRVYILPTKMGGYLNGLIFLLFLMAIGYNNNLLLIFTLVLFSFNLLWVLQTHFQLYQMKLENVFVDDGHAGTPLRFQTLWKADVPDTDWRVELETDLGAFEGRIGASVGQRLEGVVTLPERGQYQWKFLKVWTDRPFGLYQVWIYYPLQASSVAWPSLLKDLSLPDTESREIEGDKSSSRKGPEGLVSLSRYMGEESRRISWKHYAKSGELLVREGEALQGEHLRFDLRAVGPGEAREKALSYLATSLVLCHQQEISFTFQGRELLGPGYHQELLKKCLRELALC